MESIRMVTTSQRVIRVFDFIRLGSCRQFDYFVVVARLVESLQKHFEVGIFVTHRAPTALACDSRAGRRICRRDGRLLDVCLRGLGAKSILPVLTFHCPAEGKTVNDSMSIELAQSTK